MSLSICFVTAEVTPFAKAGGLGDVSAALTRILAERGHAIALFMPLYGELNHAGLAIEPIAGLDALTLQVGRQHYRYALRRGRRADGGPDLLLVDCPALFGRPGIYGAAPDEHRRFVLLMRAALEGCQRLGFRPDIVHCHDWHTALLPLYLRTVYAWDQLFAGTRSVLTIHNLGYQGVIPASAVADLGLGEAARDLDQAELAKGRIGFLRQGIADAHMVTTVSPTYAREICTPLQGMGLDDVLRGRANGVVGILNGVDVDDWDPARDRYLPHRYSASDLAGKKRMKALLQRRMGLVTSADAPLAGVVSRLNWQKGTDLLGVALPRALDSSSLQVAALGTGEPEYEAALAGLAARYPGRIAFHHGYDEELAHWVEAGADLFLMPSRYEPCGLNQMYSQRYGTVPVVRRTGGLADSVEHFDPATGQGTGVVFNDADPTAVTWAIETALAWRADRKAWTRLVRNGMSRDFSWEPQATRYVEVYARALALAR